MDTFNKKRHTASRGFTYTFYHRPGPSTSPPLPTILFLHGFPDHAHLWQGIVPHILSSGHPILIPDLLGYGGTDKPTNVAAYTSDKMTADLAEILDSAGVHKVISIGHDWGSFLAQRFFLFYPSRVAGLALFNVTYNPPSPASHGVPFNLSSLNAFFEAKTGYPRYAYWDVNAADDGEELLLKDPGRFWDLCHVAGEIGMRDHWCVRGATRAYLTDSYKKVDVRPYAQNETAKAAFIERMRRDGIAGALNWYKVTAQGLQRDAEKVLLEDPPKEFRQEDGSLRFVVRCPSLFVGASEDGVCLTGCHQKPVEEGLLPDCTFREVKAGHWAPIEVPDELGGILKEWLEKNKEKFSVER